MNPHRLPWLSIWWAFSWRCAVYSFLATLVLSIVAVACAGFFGLTVRPNLFDVVGVVGYIASIPMSVVAMKGALETNRPQLEAFCLRSAGT